MSLSLHKIIASFDDRCILNAQFELETEEQRKNYFFLKRDNLVNRMLPSTGEDAVTVEKTMMKLTEAFNETFAGFMHADKSAEFPADQVQFLASSKFFLTPDGHLLITHPSVQMKSTRETQFGARKAHVTSECTFPSAKPASELSWQRCW